MTYRYFFISNGLRGCYMPDNIYVARFTTRRQLIDLIENESRDMLEAYGFGYSKRDRVAIACRIWREATGRAPKTRLDHAIGFGRTRSTSDRPFGLFISHATCADWLEYMESDA